MPRHYLEFAHDIGTIGIDGFGADLQQFGNVFWAGMPSTRKEKHLVLPFAQQRHRILRFCRGIEDFAANQGRQMDWPPSST